MYVGLYFGSFNPVHNGHIQIAKEVLRQAPFDEVWFVVSPQNPLKSADVLAPDEHRLSMLKLAIGSTNLPIKVSDVEMSLPVPSYTYRTLEVLAERYPSHRFGLIMGSDNLAVIERWRSYEQLLRRYPIFFYPRKGDSSEALASRYGAFRIDADLLDISSTTIRQRIAEQLPIDGMVPDTVAQYIAEHKLYR